MVLQGILCSRMVSAGVGRFTLGRGFNSSERTRPSCSGGGIMGLGLERGGGVMQDLQRSSGGSYSDYNVQGQAHHAAAQVSLFPGGKI